MSPILVKICRVSAPSTSKSTLVFETIDITSAEYLTISHVWGAPGEQAYRPLPGIDTSNIHYANHEEHHGKVLLTERKANFLSSQLQQLVKEKPFWMDVLCVDQTSEDAKIAIVDQIPNIYTHASQLIAIRDGDGPRSCCVEAMGDPLQWIDEGSHKLFAHVREAHFLTAVLDENYLQRLWPLQELQLSSNVQFVSCDAWDKKPTSGDPREGEISAIRVLDHLRALAKTWLSECLYEGPAVTAFLVAFLKCGKIERDRQLGVSRALSPAKDDVCEAELNSLRRTGKVRDFVLAVMPQYEWWKLPSKSEIKAWEFSTLFGYAHALADQAGHGFLGRFTRSMLEDPASLEMDTAWTPSADVPTPYNLGDFCKLIGTAAFAQKDKFPERHGIRMNRIKVYNYTSDFGFDMTLKLIAKCMMFNRFDWSLAFRGELSQYGMLPPDRWTVIDERDDPSKPLDGENCIRIGPDIPTETIEQECIAALGSLWMSLGFDITGAVEGDWLQYGNKLSAVNPPYYKSTMVFLAAMMGCGIGLSALRWVSARFFPVVVEICEGRLVFGLLSRVYLDRKMNELTKVVDRSKFARSAMEFVCVQRLSDQGGWTGRDLVLVPVAGDGQDKYCGPVGLVSRLPVERVGEAGIQGNVAMSYRHDKKVDESGRIHLTRVDDVYM